MVRQIEKTALNTVLTINGIDSQDQGEFALKIKNRCGEDKYAIGIQVRFRCFLNENLSKK